MRQWAASRSGEEERQKRLNPGDPSAAAGGLAAWDQSHPRPHATVSQLADHVEHIRNIAGVDHLGIGADYDGVEYLPDGMGGVDGYPLLFAELIRRGWKDADLQKLAGVNVLRVLCAVEAYAAHH